MPREDDSLRHRIAAESRATEYARRVANVDETKLEPLVEHLHALAELRVQDQDFARAESLLREAMFRIEDANANYRQRPRPILAANVASSLGYLYDRWSKADKAREWYMKSLEMAKKGDFMHSDLGASVSNNLGMLDKKGGNLETAEKHYRTSLEIFRAIKGDACTETAAVLNNLGVLLYAKGSYAEARTLHERALGIRQTLHNPATGEGLADLCQTWQNLAAIHKATGEVDRAAALLRQAGVREEPAEAPTPNWVIKALGPATSRLQPERPSPAKFSVKVHQPDQK